MMRSQPGHDEDTVEGQDTSDGRLNNATTAVTSTVSASIVPSDQITTEVRHRSRRPSIKGTRSISENQFTDSSLHSPTSPALPHSHTVDNHSPAQAETAVWDWQAPTFSASTRAETSALNLTLTYHYEPQGELLLHQSARPAGVGADEFHIPGPAVSPAAHHHRRPSNPLENSFSNSSIPGGFSVRAGAKRKSAPDLYETAAKRSTLDTRETKQAGNYTSASSGKGTPTLERRTLPITRHSASSAQMVLPARKVFPIQIGDKLFRLSGASISSDAPSYFSQFFEEQLRQCSSSNNHTTSDASSVRTLYIDRDPSTFCDISLHLQGYHVEPRDGAHFVKLFADAQFFSLPRLTSQLFSSPIYTTIGSVPFQIPRDLFSATPGNEPNYFTLGFQIFFTTPSDAFPGLSQRTLLRPPSLLPPSVPNRDAAIIADLLCMLKGYEVEIKSDEHRQNLLRDARYFNFKGLEQRLIRHRISYNPRKEVEEIEIRLEDVRQSGISFVPERETAESDERYAVRGEVCYARPYVDSEPRLLVLEIGDEDGAEVLLDVGKRIGGIGFERQTAARMRKLAAIINEKAESTNPATCSEKAAGKGIVMPFGLRCEVGVEADVVIDGEKWKMASEDDDHTMDVERDERERVWVVRKSQWRIKTGSLDLRKISLDAVKLEGFSCERKRVEGRAFL